MSTSKSAAIKNRVSKKTNALVLAIVTTSLTMGVSMSAQAGSLSSLFGNNSSGSSKFLPVDQAFKVKSSTKATSKGTQLSIAFDITPEHYVYKDQLSLRFPKGVSATPFKFSQTPVSVDDPTFGQVPVFTQRSVVATTTLTTNNGKGAKNAPVVIGWQGCAEAGLCYPPEKINTKVDIALTR